MVKIVKIDARNFHLMNFSCGKKNRPCLRFLVLKFNALFAGELRANTLEVVRIR